MLGWCDGGVCLIFWACVGDVVQIYGNQFDYPLTITDP